MDLAQGFEPGLMPAAFTMRSQESEIADNAVYEAFEMSYRTERPFEVERNSEGGTVQTIPYKVKFRQETEGVIIFTLEDAEYSLTPSDSTE